MIYKLENEKIIVLDKTQFNPMHILECGQIFRYAKDEDGNYFVQSKNHIAHIYERSDCYEILSDDPKYFVEFFDLNTDYNPIKEFLKRDKILSPMVDFGYGLRILKNDSQEAIFSFIISQNNNISRIKNIIEKLCQIGDEYIDGTTKKPYKSFPTTEKLSAADFSFYKTLGAGYRDTFLKATADSLKNINIDELKNLSTDELLNFLIKQKGIGVKVASCILLFGFNRQEKFPVDTWIEQVYYNHYSDKKMSRVEIQKFFENKYKNYSGLAQQYLFFYERSKVTKK